MEEIVEPSNEIGTAQEETILKGEESLGGRREEDQYRGRGDTLNGSRRLQTSCLSGGWLKWCFRSCKRNELGWNTLSIYKRGKTRPNWETRLSKKTSLGTGAPYIG